MDDRTLFGRRPIFVARFISLSFAMSGNTFGAGLDNYSRDPDSTTLGCLMLFAFLWRRQQQQTWLKYYDTFRNLSYINELRGKAEQIHADSRIEGAANDVAIRESPRQSKPSKLSLARSRKCPGKRLTARISTSKSLAKRIAWKRLRRSRRIF
jgi:hypothetical protein